LRQAFEGIGGHREQRLQKRFLPVRWLVVGFAFVRLLTDRR
jgi:hypothetical protein